MLIVSLIGLFGIQQAGTPAAAAKKGPVTKYVRFQMGDTVAYGIVEGNRVRQLSGDLFGQWDKTDQTYALKDVQLLVPSKPTQIFALAGNYKSHVGGDDTVTTVTTRTSITTNAVTNKTTFNSTTNTVTKDRGQLPKKFQIPQPFLKPASCVLAQGGNIVLPKDAGRVDYEAEMVIVIGKRATKVSKAEALDYVLGVTCGNDVSARDWQHNDVQWWRAKGADTFGP